MQLRIVLTGAKFSEACDLQLESVISASKHCKGTWDGSELSWVENAGFVTAHVRRTKLMAAKEKLVIALAKPQFDLSQSLG